MCLAAFDHETARYETSSDEDNPMCLEEMVVVEGGRREWRGGVLQSYPNRQMARAIHVGMGIVAVLDTLLLTADFRSAEELNTFEGANHIAARRMSATLCGPPWRSWERGGVVVVVRTGVY